MIPVSNITPLASALVLVVAALQAWFLILEMFLWTTPYGRKVFGTTPEFAQASAVLAKNQGLYNGFLSAGLLLGLGVGGAIGLVLQAFCLTCVLVAGIYGGITVNRKILLVQALPAALALGLLFYLFASYY